MDKLQSKVFSGLFLLTIVFYPCFGVEDPLEGSCDFQGKVYRSGERIPQDEACHVCLCYKGKVDCLWMDCPPPPDGCEEMTLPHECNPTLYTCPIPFELSEVSNSWIRRLRRSADVTPVPLQNRNQGADCMVLGVPYNTGDLMGVASHPCLECRCARDEMYCSPRCCFSPLRLNEKPSSLMKAISRGSTLPAKHPLDHLWKEMDLIYN